MGDGDAGGDERLLCRAGELDDVPEGGDGERAADAGGAERGGDPLRDAADVDGLGHVAVLEVPPHRHLHRLALLLLLLLLLPPPLADVVGAASRSRSRAEVVAAVALDSAAVAAREAAE